MTPSVEEIQQTLNQKFDENKKLIVGVGALLLVAIVGLILYISLSRQTEEQHWSDLISSARSPLSSPVDTLTHIVDEGDAEVAPHALLNLAIAHTRSDDFEKALAALDRFESEFDNSALATLPSPETDLSLAGKLRRWIEEEKAWKDEHTIETPEVATDRVALVETSKGDFWIGFYPEISPAHVQGFIALAKEGAFNGTQVYEVDRSAVKFGGETTKDDSPLDDSDTDDEDRIAPERGRYRIPIERGSVGAVPVAGGELATRFLVVASAFAPELDKKQTIFGKVLVDRHPGLSTLDELANLKTYGKAAPPNPEFTSIPNHPDTPVRIERVSVWKDGKIEEGHGWDTSAVTAPKEDLPPEEPKDEPPEEPEDPKEEGKTPQDDGE